MDWILKYWVQELFALIIAVLTLCVKKLKGKKTEYDVLREGILALLHDRLYTACSFFIARGWASLDDRENLEYLQSLQQYYLLWLRMYYVLKKIYSKQINQYFPLPKHLIVPVNSLWHLQYEQFDKITLPIVHNLMFYILG